jgi:hypothetical protein
LWSGHIKQIFDYQKAKGLATQAARKFLLADFLLRIA